MKQNKEPLLRIAKRDGISRGRAYTIRIISVLLSLVVSGIFIFAVTKLNPIDVYKELFNGAFGTSRRSWVTIRDSMMLLCIGVGLAPAFKMKFWNIGAEGQILIGGQDIRSIPNEELRNKFGVVFQNDFLFADTIKENIRFGRELSDHDIEKAAKDAQAATFIAARADGYDDMLAIKGANLSGGQKQRLLIARALAADPEILVLDDSSSALDYKTDALLRAAVTANFSHTTTVIVAQRISSIAHADKILVLSGGKIVAAGKHEELLSSCELYKEISLSQMGGAVLD